MEKVGNKLKSLTNVWAKDVFVKYPLTITCVVLAAILWAALADSWNMEDDVEDVLNTLMSFLWIFSTGSLVTEEYLGKRGWLKLAGLLPAVLYGVLYILVFCVDSDRTTMLGISVDLFRDLVQRYYIAISASLVVMSVYHMYRTSGLEFVEYCMRVISNVTKAAILYTLCAVGIACVGLVAGELLLSWDYVKILSFCEVFLFGGIFVPSLLFSASKVTEETGKFMEGLLRYALLPLTLVVLVIIYLYLLQIVLTWIFPTEETFSAFALIIIFSLLVCVMVGNSKKSIMEKIAVRMSVAFLAGLLIFACLIGVQIYQNGYSPILYYEGAFLIFEILCLFLFLIRKGRFLHLCMPAFCVILFVTIACPFFNANHMGVLIYRGVIEDALERGLDEISWEEENEVRDAYSTLLHRCGAEGRIYMREELGDAWPLLSEWYNAFPGSVYSPYPPYTGRNNGHGEEYEVTASGEWNNLNITNYSNIIRVYCKAGYEMDEYVTDTSNLTFYQREQEDNYWNLDISEWLAGGMEYYLNYEEDSFDRYLTENRIIEVDEQYDFFITLISINYYEDGAIDHITMEGYLLEKMQ